MAQAAQYSLDEFEKTSTTRAEHGVNGEERRDIIEEFRYYFKWYYIILFHLSEIRKMKWFIKKWKLSQHKKSPEKMAN